MSTKLSGQWYKSYEATGTGTASSAQGRFVYKFADRAYDGKTPDPNYGDVHVRNNYPNDASLTADSNNGAASAELSGVSIKVTYRWIPDFRYGYGLGPYPQGMQLEDPSPKLGFLVRSHAGAGAGLQGEASASVDGKKGVLDAYKNSYIQLKRLYSFDTKGQTEFSAVIPFSGKANLPAGNHMYGSATVNFDAYADIDNTNRAVRISRGVSALPEKILVNGAWVDNPDLHKDRDEWVEADGTGHGHTLASYKERIALPPLVSGGNSQVRNDPRDVLQTFTASRSSTGWSNNLQFQWSPSDTTDTINSSTQTMPRTSAISNPEGIRENVMGGEQGTSEDLKGWLNTPAAKGQDFTVTYDLTDNADNATATGKYVLKLHDEWENGTPDNIFGSSQTYEEQYFVPAGAVAVTKDTEATWKITQTNEFVVELKAFFKSEFKLADWGSAGGSLESSKKMDLQTVIGTQAGKPSEIYTTHGPDVRYLSVVVYQATRSHKLFDHFGANGFLPDIGTEGKTAQSKIESIGQPRADWWPFRVGNAVPPEGSTGTYYTSGGAS